MFKRLILILLTIGFIPLAIAHDPGISRAKIQLMKTGMTVQMTFSRTDIDTLKSMDINHDGIVSDAEVISTRSEMVSFLINAVDVRHANGNYRPKSVHVEPVKGDALNFNFQYEFANTATTRLTIPLIAELARGHRQYLTIHDANGELQSQHMLSADSPAVVLQASAQHILVVLRQYLLQGVWHIWAGLDHLLFLLTLVLPTVLVYKKPYWQAQPELRPALMDTIKVVTAFTIAHSITLSLAVLHVVAFPPRIVESVIAFSVLIAAVNNLRPFLPVPRWVLAFVFGLVHGFGFASVLASLGLAEGALITSLLGFNLGVELGQLVIVALVFPVFALIRHTLLYRNWVFTGGSVMTALIAMVWMFERIFDVTIPEIQANAVLTLAWYRLV